MLENESRDIENWILNIRMKDNRRRLAHQQPSVSFRLLTPEGGCGTKSLTTKCMPAFFFKLKNILVLFSPWAPNTGVYYIICYLINLPEASYVCLNPGWPDLQFHFLEMCLFEQNHYLGHAQHSHSFRGREGGRPKRTSNKRYEITSKSDYNISSTTFKTWVKYHVTLISVV